MDLKNIVFLLLLLIVSSKTENEKEEYKLTGNIIPYHYEVELTVPINFGSSGKFFGKIKIQLLVHNSTSVIEFHSNKLMFNKTNIGLLLTSDITNNVYTAKDHRLEEKLQKSIVTFDRPLRGNSNYSLTIDNFEGVLDVDMLGFYRASYKNANNEFEWIATTQFEPTNARRAFPCFDEPEYKATFKFVLNHPSDYHALSNADVNEVRMLSDMKQTVFEKTPKMSTYTVAFAITKYVSLSTTSNLIKHEVWSPIEKNSQGQYALSISLKFLKAMERITGIPYAVSNLTNIKHMSIPDFSAGAMENWGLVTYRETVLLWNPQTSSMRNKQRVGSVIAHELSHMWFGNLVTTKWWSATWLNEGFARYFEYIGLAEVEDQWDMENQFVVEQHQRILVSDALNKSKPLTNYNTFSLGEINGMFDTNTYSKGGSIVRMMSLFMGREVFYKALQSYLSTYKFSSTIPLNLFTTLNNYVEPKNVLPDTVTKIMTNWTEKAGFPLITVKLLENKVFLHQSQFGLKNSTNSTTWFVPITYTTSTEKDFSEVKPKIWMLPNVPEIYLTDIQANNTSWIILNIKCSAFLRVNYDDRLWDGLRAALNKINFDDIIPINRAQLVDDAMNLARASVISYKRALDITLYLKKELNYYPWYSAFNAFAYLRRRIGEETVLFKLLNKHIQGLMQNLYQNVTFDVNSKDQIEIHKQVLALSWGCKLNMKECVSKTQKMFNSFKKEKTMLNPNLRDVVYCSATRYATDNTNWEFLWKRLENNPSADEVIALLSALGCTSDEVLLKRYLNESIKEGSVIRRQDAQTVFNSVISGSSKGVEIGLNFLSLNFQNISERYGGMNALTTVIVGLADRLTTKEQVNRLETFIAKNKDHLKDAVTAAGSAIENAKKNLDWMDKHEKELLEYLQARERNAASSKYPIKIVLVLTVIINIFIIL